MDNEWEKMGQGSVKIRKRWYAAWNISIIFSISPHWLFPSCTVAGMTADLPTPHRSVHLLVCSQPNAFQVSLAHVFPSCFRSSSLPFPWCNHPQRFPQYVFFITSSHVNPVQSSLRDLFGTMRHSRCSSDVFVHDLVFVCYSAHLS